MANLYLARTESGQGYAMITGAKDTQVANVGTVTGDGIFKLGETEEGTQSTVFDIMQMDSDSAMKISMDSNDSNIRFTGYNINADFNQDANYGYNVELNTVNSVFDFSGTEAGAFVTATQYSANNRINLGGNAQRPLGGEILDGDYTLSGEKEVKYYNNYVWDSGDSNSYFSSSGAQTRFETTEASIGAFMSGGTHNDVFFINGQYGTFSGNAGNNTFISTDKSQRNVMIGGTGSNLAVDNGNFNMYLGSYGYAGKNGDDTIRMFGNYGMARIDTSKGADGDYDIRGSYSSLFTGDSAEINGVTYNFDDIFNDYGWNTFFSSELSPAGYAAQYSRALLQNY